MSPTFSNRFEATYPTASMRARLITRLEERSLGWVSLDALMAEELGREQLGWFVGGHPGSSILVEQIASLDAKTAGGIWVVIPFSRDLSIELFEKWPYFALVARPPDKSNSAWTSRKVWVAIPEDLRHVMVAARQAEPGIAGAIVVDPPCIMYRSRGGTDARGNFHRSDRPQHVVNFRSALDFGGWQPPLFLVTEKPAKSINTEVVARAYCLHGFKFVAGDSFYCGEVDES